MLQYTYRAWVLELSKICLENYQLIINLLLGPSGHASEMVTTDHAVLLNHELPNRPFRYKQWNLILTVIATDLLPE